MFADLTDPRLMYLKGLLFVLLGLFASVLLVAQSPTLAVAGLLAIAVWAFCRAYYFAFYVIQRYVDPHERFDGLIAAMMHLMTTGARDPAPPAGQDWVI